MNAKMQLKIDIIEKIISKKISIQDAAAVLNVSERTIRRCIAGFGRDGIKFFIHKNTNRAPSNKISTEIILKAKNLIKKKYFDFNMLHCLEKLSVDEKININRETFRKACHEMKMVKRQHNRRSRVRKLRTRTPQAGLFLQMDGSHHRWFNDEESCLIGAVDDATSENYYSEFFEGETTMGCLKVLKNIILKKGLFSILYVDRAGLFGGPKRTEFAQVKRALAELNIQIIFANSAEAKGRIERHWNTLQDRLIPEMRLRKIKNFESANHFLQTEFLPGHYNKKFKVIPSNLEPGWKSVPVQIDLDQIFCIKEYRTIASDHTYSYNGQIYRITENLKYSIKKQKIEIRKYLDSSVKVYFADREILTEVYHRPVQLDLDQKLELIFDEKNAIKVRKDSHVYYQNKYYSMHPGYIGKLVNVQENEDSLLFYIRKTLIESHLKIKSKFIMQSTKPEHLGPWQKYLIPTSVYRTAAKHIGANCDQLIFTILQRGQGVVDNKNIWAIIELKKQYPRTAVNEACGFALAATTADYRGVASYLRLRYKKASGV